MLKIDIKYHVEGIDKIAENPLGNWIDLRCAEDVSLKAGEFKLISLGVSMALPNGYEAHLVPRSSTFKKWGIIQANHMGVIDNSYSGDNDIWYFPAIATKDVVIEKNSRICQFRLMKISEPVEFTECEHLNTANRGGFGSTGYK